MAQTDMVLIVKRLQRSELGLFDAHRKTDSTKSRQRGLNLDTNILKLILTPEQRAEGAVFVHATYRTPSGRVVFESQPRPIKHQSKNWRLTGNRLPETEFQLLTPGDFILLLFQLDVEVHLYWEAMRASESEPAREALVAFLMEVAGEKTTALEREPREIVLGQWKAVSPSLFTLPDPVGVRYKQATLL